MDTENTFSSTIIPDLLLFGSLHVSNQKRCITFWIQFTIIVFHNSSSASSHASASLIGHTKAKCPAKPCPFPHLCQCIFLCFIFFHMHTHVHTCTHTDIRTYTHTQEKGSGSRIFKARSEVTECSWRLLQQFPCAR